MTAIMQALEIRYYEQGSMIQKELDECAELLFIFEGKYNVGYEINKIIRYRRQFGQSTIIGGFEICTERRFMFHYQAQTDIIGYAIRKSQWLRILTEFPNFKV